MNKNRLIIAAAGSGKTTFIIDDAVRSYKDNILITTYTEANESEIKSKLFSKYKTIPSHISIQTWFSFLIQHGLKPYQGTFNPIMFNHSITGLLLVNIRSGAKYDSNGNIIISDGHPQYWSEDYFQRHYFTKNWKIYSDKLSKLVCKIDKATNYLVSDRISRIYSKIYVDEVQDLAGYDLQFIKSLMKASSSITLVGDPRQVTYLTHNENKFAKYSNGNIKQFLLKECKSLVKDGIDETTLSVSHRNNSAICYYSSKLFSNFSPSLACTCAPCRASQESHTGIYLVHPSDVNSYLAAINPVQLRWSSSIKTNPEFKTFNFGESKGRTFDHVLLYPTSDMKAWVFDNSKSLKDETRAKFYVGLTRARHSAGIITDFNSEIPIDGVQFYQF